MVTQPACRVRDLPRALVQMVGVILHTPRLPEAAGPRAGAVGRGRPLRLLILGDSSAAGVGVAHQDEALAGRLVAALARDFAVDWRLIARSGATTSRAIALARRAPADPVDVAVTVLGVNDTLRGVSPGRWRAGQHRLADLLGARFGARLILANAVPPLGLFPAFPAPLRSCLGVRAGRLDAALGEVAQAQDGLIRIRPDLPVAPDLFARDGFHPGARLYRLWAEDLARRIRSEMLSADPQSGPASRPADRR